MANIESASAGAGLENNTVSIEDVRRHTALLKDKIAQARKDSEKEASPKIAEREQLIAEAKRIDQLIKETEDSLALSKGVVKSLLSEQDKQVIEGIERTNASLKAMLHDISAQIDSISENSTVEEMLHDKAKRMDARKTLWKTLKDLDIGF